MQVQSSVALRIYVPKNASVGWNKAKASYKLHVTLHSTAPPSTMHHAATATMLLHKYRYLRIINHRDSPGISLYARSRVTSIPEVSEKNTKNWLGEKPTARRKLKADPAVERPPESICSCYNSEIAILLYPSWRKLKAHPDPAVVFYTWRESGHVYVYGLCPARNP